MKLMRDIALWTVPVVLFGRWSTSNSVKYSLIFSVISWSVASIMLLLGGSLVDRTVVWLLDGRSCLVITVIVGSSASLAELKDVVKESVLKEVKGVVKPLERRVLEEVMEATLVPLNDLVSSEVAELLESSGGRDIGSSDAISLAL